MALKYGGVVYRNLEEQVRKNMEDISELDGRIEELSGKATGGVAVVLNGISEATQGTLTADQLATLQESNENYILLNNEIYLLMDKQTADGYLTYSHVGVSNQKQMIKTLTITISALSWVVIEMEIGSGGGSGGGSGIYLHKFKLDYEYIDNGHNDTAYVVLISNRSTPYPSVDELWSVADGGASREIFYITASGGTQRYLDWNAYGANNFSHGYVTTDQGKKVLPIIVFYDSYFIESDGTIVSPTAHTVFIKDQSFIDYEVIEL